MGLWEFALAAWARPAVVVAALALQDRHGENVSLLLAGLWLGWRRRPLDLSLAALMRQRAQQWESRWVGPLRALRRQADELDADGHDLKARLRAAEVEAERLLLEQLEQLALAAQVPQGAGASMADWLDGLQGTASAPARQGLVRAALEMEAMLESPGD